jgi:hypothetical protein
MIYQQAHFVNSLLNMQTQLVFSCSGKNGVYFMFVLLVAFCQTCPISRHAAQRHSSVHGVHVHFSTY